MPKTNKNYKLKKQNSYKKSCKHKSYKNKSIKNYNKKYNSINGGAANSPISTKCALFFDNYADNLKFVNVSCPNVICTNVIKIKVEDSSDSYEPTRVIVLDKIKHICTEDKIDYKVYIKEGQYIKYDEKSGIKTKELEQLNTFFKTYTYNFFKDTRSISDIIFDFDRTFTMVEGIYGNTKLFDIAKSFNKEETDDNKNVQNYLNLIMGGIERRQAMKQLLETCLEKKIIITILTNNDLPNLYKDLIPDVIRLILELKSVETKINIISTCSLERNRLNLQLPKKQVSKFNKLNELQICKDTDINTITDVKTKLLAAVPSLVIQ